MQEEWNGEDGAGRLVGGAVTWEVDGGRREVPLQVVELARGGRLQRAGLWAPRAGLAWQRPAQPADLPPPDSMTNRTFTVLIAEVWACTWVYTALRTVRLSEHNDALRSLV